MSKKHQIAGVEKKSGGVLVALGNGDAGETRNRQYHASHVPAGAFFNKKTSVRSQVPAQAVTQNTFR